MRQSQGKKAWVNPVLCKGDGLCNTKCPTGAIQLKHFTDEELLSQIDAAVPEKEISCEKLKRWFKPYVRGITNKGGGNE
jgi:ferredoxin